MSFCMRFTVYISANHFVLHCFDTVCWRMLPIKIVPKMMTCCVSGETLNLTYLFTVNVSIGWLTQERFDDMPEPKFLYGSHYSSPAHVLFYLARAGICFCCFFFRWKLKCGKAATLNSAWACPNTLWLSCACLVFMCIWGFVLCSLQNCFL